MRSKVPWARATFCVLLMLYVLYMLHPALAFAGQGSATITQQNNSDASYDAYQVFSASIDEEGKATGLSWASEGTKQVVLGFLDEHGYTTWLEERHPGEGQSEIAQNAAEYICARFDGSMTAEETETEAGSSEGVTFATELAQALASSELEPTSNAHTGEEFVAEQGYWLLVTDMATISAPDDAGTAPIWLIVGATHEEVVEKTSLPTASFSVQEDSTHTWQKVADSNREQSLPYRIEGTLPDNFEAFGQYHYRFEVSLPQDVKLDLPEGKTLGEVLTVSVGSANVEVDGTNVTASYSDSLLVLDFADLHSDFWSAYEITNASTIAVEYRAYLSSSAAVGMPGHTSEAVLVYTADPISLAESTTQAMPVTVFTYQLELLKADSQTGTLIAGAAFSLSTQDEGGTAESKLYVQGDGSLGTTLHTFTTDEHGKVLIAGLDEGSYTLVEESAPDGYRKLDSEINVTITTSLSQLDRSIEDFTISKDKNAACEVLGIEPDKGSASLQVINTRIDEQPSQVRSVERMPQTGVGPTAELLVASGVALVGISLYRGRRRR